jgi:hypothetical protein
LDGCQFVHVYEIKDEKGNPKEKRQKCGLRIGIRTVEFRHPDYRDLSREFSLCESHYREVFGVIRDQEREAWRKKQNAIYKYKGYKANHYRRVEDEIRKWDNIRKRQCRLELCNISLRSMKKVFPVRVFNQTGVEYSLYYFCCENHWKRKMYAIEPRSKDQQKVMPKTLDDYKEEIKA